MEVAAFLVPAGRQSKRGGAVLEATLFDRPMYHSLPGSIQHCTVSDQLSKGCRPTSSIGVCEGSARSGLDQSTVRDESEGILGTTRCGRGLETRENGFEQTSPK